MKFPTFSELPERIFVDATYTLCSGKNSGIERVVRSLVREYSERIVAGSPRPELVFTYRGKFYPVDEATERAFHNAAKLYGNILCHLPKWYSTLASRLCSLFPTSSLKKWILPEAGHLGWFKLPMTLHRHHLRQRAIRSIESVEPGANDLVLLPDAYWTCMDVADAARDARSRGATVATVIYDLIPITHPEVVGTKRSLEFAKYVREAATNSDVLIAISNTVRNQVIEYVDQHLSNEDYYCRDVRSFTLGAELKTVDVQGSPVVQDLFKPDSTQNPYLMVATFDPRKNHSYILDAFDELWKSKPDLKLCLIGRVGWSCKDVLDRISVHPRLGKQLFVVHDASDADLQHCYRHARAVISPSIVEGFGLPIVESLWYGCETIVSDTPIHREVGGDRCRYFDLSDMQSLCHIIHEFELSDCQRSQWDQPKYRITTWRESAQFLMHHCLDAYAKKVDKPSTSTRSLNRAA